MAGNWEWRASCNATRMHAHELSTRFRRALLAALAAPAVAACGGVVDGGNDSGVPGCNAEPTEAGAASCGSTNLQLSGDISACHVGLDDAGSIPTASCQALCGTQFSYCTLDTSTEILTCQSFCTGRLPACLRPGAGTSGTTNAVGEYLARVAYLEAASVDAFAILAAELRAHGAPRSLVRSAQRAGADEVRHAREVGALATAFGVAAAKPVVARSTVRPLVDVAIENAVEGCVRETFGALVATWQAEHARDERVLAAMKRIARDETRHAALGWRIFEWTMSRLDARARDRVERAMVHATHELERSARAEPHASVVALLGVPPASRMVALLHAMQAELSGARAAA